MRKIHSFSSFNALNEADTASDILKVAETESSKLYDQTLGLILTTALNSYSSELNFPVKIYDPNIDADIASIKSSPIEGKPDAFKKVMVKVQKAAEDNKLEGAKEAVEAWVAAGSKAADALVAMINQYKDQPEELKHINNFVNAKLDSFTQEIEDSSKENELKMAIANKANESESFDDEIFEGIFQGKKGMIEDVSKQITLVNAKLASLAQTPGMASEVQKLQNEVTQISAKMGELLGKSNKEISKEEIKKAAARLAEIPTEADKIAEKMLKQDATNKEAASILVQALALVQDAKNKEVSYLQKKGEALQKEKNDKIKVVLPVDRVDYDPAETKKVNPEVKKFQELVVDKFGKIKMITSLPQYSKMGTDGKFGQNTRDIVKVLKKGFGLSDSSGDITKELVDEIQIQADTIKESINSRVYTFSDFVSIYEAAFNTETAVEYAKSLPTYSSTPAASAGSSSGSKSSGGSSSSMIFKEGSKGPEVTAIQNVVGAVVKGTDEEKNQTFGPKTKQAVMAWQKSNGLKEDGIVGSDTIKKMSEIKNLGKWTASMISKLAGSEVKPIEVKPEEKGLNTNVEIQNAANGIIAGSVGGGTDESKILSSIKSIKSKKDFEILQSLLKRSMETREIDIPGQGVTKTYTYTLPQLGIKQRAPFGSVQEIINDEMGSGNTGTIQDIADYLKSIKVNASFSKDDSGDFKENSFKIS